PENVSEKSAPIEKESKKKVWKEDGKWQHDRFSVYDQSPKSREELVATYGYDIRNEEGPPRARRRRRYGRGPNKYTRNWEDVDAYSKPTRGKTEIRRGKGRGRKKMDGSSTNFSSSGNEFSPLPSTRDEDDQIDIEVHDRVTVEPSSHVEIPKYVNSANATEPYDGVKTIKNTPSVDQVSRGYSEESKQDVRAIGRGNRPNRRARAGVKGIQRNHNYHEGGQFVNRGRRDAGRGRGEGKPRSSGWVGHVQQQMSPVSTTYQQKEIQEITEELKTITITPSQKEDHHYKKRGVDNRRNTIPPRLQESMRGNKSVHSVDSNSVLSKPKRYSSQRQAFLCKTRLDNITILRRIMIRILQNLKRNYIFMFLGFSNKIYDQTVSSPGTGAPPPLSLTGQAPQPPPPSFVAPYTTTSASTYPAAPPARLFPSGAPQPHLIGPPVPGPPLGAPPVAGPGVPGPPVPGTVGGPPVTGPPFLPPENMINYAPGAPGLVAAPHPPQFPPFQAFTPVSQQQPQEIYSNGVTYYNTQSQQHLPRINPVLQKRPKVAIPIVPPPEKAKYSKQRNENEQENFSETYEICNENNSVTSSSNDYVDVTPDNLIQEDEDTSEKVYLEESVSSSEEAVINPVSPSESSDKSPLVASPDVDESPGPLDTQDSEISSDVRVEVNNSEVSENSEEKLDTTEPEDASTVNGEEHIIENSVPESSDTTDDGSSTVDLKTEVVLDPDKKSAEVEIKVESEINVDNVDPSPIVEAT
ncbi:Protein CASC3, partial [Armadillidium vulgare]